MSTENEDEKIAFKKEIKELVQRVTEKARKESMGSTKNAWGNYLEENSALTSKTFVRMYDRYIGDDLTKPNPSDFTLNAASKYVGCESFADFCKQNFPEENGAEKKPKEELIEKEENKKTPQKKVQKLIFGLGIASILSIGSYFGIGAVNQPQCMYWNKNHYQAIHCDEDLHPNIAVIPIDEQKLKHFKKIEVSDTTTFFEAGKAVVWYRKVDGEIEFYSAPGNHPINGEELRKVSIYIVDKYVFNK